MADNYSDEGSEDLTNMANGEWFTNDMHEMFIAAIQTCAITSMQAHEITAINGRSAVEEIDSTYLIPDIRVPNGDDFHKKAEFIGYIKPFQARGTFRYP